MSAMPLVYTVQDDRKVIQHTLKYLLMAEIQYNSIGLPNTHRCDYIRAHAGRASPTNVQCLPKTTWHLVLTWLTRMSLGIAYISRFSCAKQTDIISSGETFPWHTNSSPGRIKHEEKRGCTHRWTRWTFPTFNTTVFLFSDCNVIYFLAKQNVSGMGCVTFRSPYFCVCFLSARKLVTGETHSLVPTTNVLGEQLVVPGFVAVASWSSGKCANTD
jgi:hypothetical protein